MKKILLRVTFVLIALSYLCTGVNAATFSSHSEDFAAGLPSAREFASTATGILESDTYYLNNTYSGRYLYKASSGVSVTSGTISTYGNLIQWEISALSDGSYTIRSANNSSLYLSASTTSNDSSVSLTTLSNSDISNEYRWIVTYASGGGCLIRNVHTEKYLSFNGTALTSSSTLGTVGTDLYEQKIWRTVKISLYGNGSQYTYQELPSSFSFNSPIVIFSGETATLAISNEHSDSLWTTANDFTYSGYSASMISFNTSSGVISVPTGSTSPYSATITATHKVTGYSTSFVVTLNPKAILVGVDEPDHDHYSALQNASAALTRMDFGAAPVYTGAFTRNNISEYLSNNANYVFASRSHGGVFYNAQGGVAQTFIALNNSNASIPIRYVTNGDIKTLDLSNMKLVMFIGCETAAGGENANNLPSVAVTQGAETAIGFIGEIYCDDANVWTSMFFAMMEDGLSYETSCAYLTAHPSYLYSTMSSYVICGNKYGTIR